MEPEQFSPVPEETRHYANRVTPLSKYLAMALFVILPFIGGYIGYTFAPEKVVEVKKEVSSEVKVNENVSNEGKTETSSLQNEVVEVERYLTGVGGDKVYKLNNYYDVPYPLIVSEACSVNCDFKIKNRNDDTVLVNISEEYRAIRDDEKVELVKYEYGNKDVLYFRVGIPDSGGCCSMVVYNIKDNSFDRVTEYRGPEASVVADNSLVIASDLQNVTVFDLDRNIAPIKQIKLGDEETLAQSDCGMQGPVPDLFVSEFGSRMFYGVYKDVEVTDCNARPQVEIREIVLD